jgi:hypothetical protein
MINTFPSAFHHFSAIIVSNKSVGIDIELQREKIRMPTSLSTKSTAIWIKMI